MIERSARNSTALAAGALLLCLAAAVPVAANDPSAAPAELPAELERAAHLVRQIRSSTIDAAATVDVRNVELELGDAVLDIQQGMLFPARIADGRTTDVVFVGEARFRLDAPDEIESRQLELFSGRRSIDVSVSEAVIVLADPQVLATLFERPLAAPEPELVARVEEAHANWLLQPERRNTGVESSIFKMLVDDRLYRDYFALWARSYEIGEFVFQLDPEEEEQLTLASFTPVDARGWDRLRLKRQIRIQQRKGRWLGVRVDDLGAWDVWHSAEWSPMSLDAPGNASFETVHYGLDVKIKHDRLMLEGVATLDLHTQLSGRRVLTFDLYRDLVVDEVTDEQGRKLFSFRSGQDTAVLLPEPSVAGRRFKLRVAYHGRALYWVGRQAFDLEETGTWYPRVGAIDRATHDVKLTWPKKHELIASGRVVEEGHDKRYRWQRRVLDRPATDFSFVLGDFVVERRQLTRAGSADVVDLTVAIDTAAPARLTDGLRERVIDSITGAFRYYEETFGPYPLDHLTVATLPRQYSQSYYGFIVLTDSIVQDDDPFGSLRVGQVRETLVAHEMAHQWWGNLVGWWSYRDQWLSEAMSNYCSLLYYANKEGRDATFLAQMSAGWRNMLDQRTRTGHTIESMGPVVLGGRLNSSLSSQAYQAIVYRKGAVVLAMLARAVGEERFLAMLRTFIETLGDNVLTTESFIAGIERMSGLELDGFARRFIYGTGIPAVYYDYDAQPADDGTWTVRGEARLLTEPTFTFRVTRPGGDGWDVARIAGPDSVAAPAALMVPYRISGREPDPGRSERATGVSRGDWGRLMIEGRRQAFALRTTTKPEELQLDPRGETLARFYSVNRHPKRGLRFRATDLALQGRFDEAEATFLQALGVAAVPESERGNASSRGEDAATEDGRIRLALARLYLDQRRPDAAAAQLEQAEGLLLDSARMRLEREVLQSRLEVQRGDYDSAWRRLRRTLRVVAPEREARTFEGLLDQIQLTTDRQAVIEAFALLAIAAHETGNTDDYRWSLAAAVARGVDVSPLEQIAGR